MIDAARVFISYAKEDERWLKEVTTHLDRLRHKGLIASFDDRQISVGDRWDEAIQKKLEEADLVVLLVTKYFLASAYIHQTELRRALERDEAGECRMLPIIISTCDWEEEEFAKEQAYPRPGPDGLVPVAKWQDPDEPLTALTKDLRKWATELAQRRAAERANAAAETQTSRSAEVGMDLDLYHRRALKRWETIDLTALALQAATDVDARPTLARVFVPQDCRHARPPQAVPHDWLAAQGLDPDIEEAHQGALQWQQEPRISTLDLLAHDNARRLVLLGVPGSGKSSLARFVVLELLRPMPSNEARVWRRALDGYVPFLVELRDLTALDAPGKPCSIPAYLADMGERLRFGFTAAAVERQLRERPSLLIIDGLDEIFDLIRRRQIAQEIIGLETCYPSARVLLTSRVAGFDAAPFEAADFTIATLDDLSEEQVRSFARSWFDLAFPDNATTAEQTRTDLLESIERRPQLKALASNPLMLTITAMVARTKRLARSRAELYHQVLDLLCYGWDYRKGLKLPPDSPLADLEPDDTLRMLRRIAWRMQEGKDLRANAITAQDLKAELEAFFDVHWKVGPAKARKAAAEMIRLIDERTWLVTPRGPGLFGFVHRTFLEYLCAEAIADRWSNGDITNDELITMCAVSYATNDAFHEIVRLTSARLPVRISSMIIDAMISNNTAHSYMYQSCGLVPLSFECLAEQNRTRLFDMKSSCCAAMKKLYKLADEVWSGDPRESTVEPEWNSDISRIEAALASIGSEWPEREQWLEEYGVPTFNYDDDVPPYINRYKPIIQILVRYVFHGLPQLHVAISQAEIHSNSRWASHILADVRKELRISKLGS